MATEGGDALQASEEKPKANLLCFIPQGRGIELYDIKIDYLRIPDASLGACGMGGRAWGVLLASRMARRPRHRPKDPHQSDKAVERASRRACRSEGFQNAPGLAVVALAKPQ
jgi:hypothetical protein